MKLTLFVFLSVLFHTLLQAQQSYSLLHKADSLATIGEYEAAIKLREQHLQTINSNDTAYNDYIFSLAKLYNANKQYYKAVNLYETSLNGYLKNTEKNKEKLADNYNNLALAYEAIGRYDKSISYLTKAYNIVRKYYSNNIGSNITGMGNLITALIDNGDMKAAKNLLDTLNEYRANFNHPPLRKEWNKLNAYEKWNRDIFILLTAIRYYANAGDEKNIQTHIAALEKKFTPPLSTEKKNDLAHLLEAYDAIAYQYRISKNYTKALEYYAKAEALVHEDFYKMKAAAHKAIIYNIMGKYQDAYSYVEKALTVFQFPPENNSHYGLIALKAELLQSLHKNKEAVKQLEQLYSLLLKQNITADNFSTFFLNQFTHKINHTQIIIFIKSGNIYYGMFNQSKQKEHLTTATHFYTLAAQLFKTYYSREFYNKALDDLNKQITEKILTVSLEQKNTDYSSAVNLIENNTSKHLWKKFLSRYSENLKTPYELLNKRNMLAAALSNYEILDNKTQEDKKQQQQLNQQIAVLDKEISKTDQFFHTFQSEEFAIKNIQKKLHKNQLIIKYTVADNKVYGLAVTYNNIYLHEIGSIAHLQNQVNLFHAALKNISPIYKKNAETLFTLLVKPFYEELKNTTDIIIIPEDFLSFLPFEALINPNTNHLLITDYTISYSYALQLWQLQNAANKHITGTVAFAPDYPNLPLPVKNAITTRGDLYNLENTSKEAAQIVQINKGVLYNGNNATKNNFLNSLGKYGIYHLAMHAQIDNNRYENSNLIFSNDEKLHFYQLYALNFPAQMVVLSACNTGIGTMQHGEGLMSLSRALVYSGVQSSVYSLWEVPDKETAELMILFYKNLGKGQSKDEALKNAKQQFIKNNPAKSHPYYWAGFVINGNTQPIKNTNYTIWLILVGGVIILLSGWWIKKKYKKTTYSVS